MVNLSEEQLVFYINGKWFPKNEAYISVEDFGWRSSITIFEGICIYGGAIFKLDEHLNRLQRSAIIARIKIPPNQELKEIVKEFARKNKIKDGHFQLRISPGRGRSHKVESGPTITVFGYPRVSYENFKRNFRLKTTAVRDIPPECQDPRIKTGANYFNGHLARQEAQFSKCDDALTLDIRGFVSEATGSNIFVIKDNILRTPHKFFVLEGITRNTIIDLARNAGYKVFEEDMTLYDVYTADEVFLCGSAFEVTPVVEVDGIKIGEGKCGPVTTKLQGLFKEYTLKPGPWRTEY